MSLHLSEIVYILVRDLRSPFAEMRHILSDVRY